MDADWLIENVHIATMQSAHQAPYGTISDGLLAVSGGCIAWVGERRKAPAFNGAERIEGRGGWITPGLIDCHTHLVYGGDRTREFELRLQGQSYADIARSGGGIASTVAATRAAGEEELLQQALNRLRALHAEGVTTVEIKSGYGLDLETELRMLRVTAALADHLPVQVHPTYLGAHALPPEYSGRADAYIDYVCDHVMPTVADLGLASAVDVFCDEVGFSLDQCRRVLTTARDLGLPVKGHVEQLSYQGGAVMLAEFGALSVDHLEYLGPDEIKQLKEEEVVAVLLPGAFYFLGETRTPPIAALRETGVRMAVATDCNPGSSPIASLLTSMNLACLLFGLTPEEALRGVTIHAAHALGVQRSKGQLAAGYDADLLLWEIEHPAALAGTINMQRPARIWSGGRNAASA